MQITIIKGASDDRIDACRADGTKVSTRFPKKGPVPHDAVHYFVESELRIANGFWGMVAAGHDPEEIASLAKAAGHASAKRARVPDPTIVAIVQAERAVECFEADLWGGGGADNQSLRDLVAAGCAQSLVPPIAVSDAAIMRIRGALADLRDRWSRMKAGESMTLNWEVVV